ncbi:hypothetical protein [Halorientalis sp.]|uniref:hypothetical protein n=1 Tax=Halorientalis sp. TaxID=1931229 RepID=UPI00261D1A38|nr:hypothetical protein [Halorientalis sp.]
MTIRNHEPSGTRSGHSQPLVPEASAVAAGRTLGVRQEVARVVVVAGDSRSAQHYASWLVDRHETRMVRHGRAVPESLDASVLVVDRRVPMPDQARSGGRAERLRDGWRVLSTVSPGSSGWLVDEYVASPVARGELLERVGTARRVAAYEATIATLSTLTERRRELRDRSGADRSGGDAAVRRLSERIDRLHRRIDYTLSDIESRYPELLGRQRDLSARSTAEAPTR